MCMESTMLYTCKFTKLNLKDISIVETGYFHVINIIVTYEDERQLICDIECRPKRQLRVCHGLDHVVSTIR